MAKAQVEDLPQASPRAVVDLPHAQVEDLPEALAILRSGNALKALAIEDDEVDGDGCATHVGQALMALVLASQVARGALKAQKSFKKCLKVDLVPFCSVLH